MSDIGSWWIDGKRLYFISEDGEKYYAEGDPSSFLSLTKNVGTVNEELYYKDDDGVTRFLYWDPVDDVDLTGNIGIIGNRLLYRDEDGVMREVTSKYKV